MATREINVLNELGLKQRQQQSKLLALALSKPEYYYELREEVEERVLHAITKNVYTLFKDLLIDGKAPNLAGTGIEDIEYKGIDGNKNQKFKPAVPESDVIAFCLDIADMIESKCEECIEILLPKDKNQLAMNKQRSILKARTGLD
jgi:hypothetical protein